MGSFIIKVQCILSLKAKYPNSFFEILNDLIYSLYSPDLRVGDVLHLTK